MLAAGRTRSGREGKNDTGQLWSDSPPLFGPMESMEFMLQTMDPMEFVVQQAEGVMPPPQQFHGLQRQQHHVGCPYFQQQHHHQSSLPPPFADQHLPSHSQPQPQPHSDSNNHPLPHQQQSPNRNLPPNQQQPQQQSLTRPQQPSLPHPHPHPHPHLHPQPQPYVHSSAHYDPVHSAGSSWNQHQGPAPAFQWPRAFPATQGHSNRLPVPDQLYFTGGAAAPAGPGHSSGPVQPPLIPPPHHDSWAVQLPSYRHPLTSTRFHSAVPQQNNHPLNSHHQQTLNSSNEDHGNTPSIPMDSSQNRGAPPQSSRGISLPSLIPDSNPHPNPNPNPLASQPTQPTASSSGEPRSVVLPPVNSTPLFTASEDPARPSDRGPGNGASLSSSSSSAVTVASQLPRPPLFGAMEPLQRTDASSTAGSAHPASDPDRPLLPPNSAMPPGPDRRRYYNAPRRVPRPQIPPSVSQHSDYDSDDDLDRLMDDADEQTLQYIEEFSVGHPQFRALTEDHVRASQILRGQMSNKRVASKKALSQLQSVDLSTLPESDRSMSFVSCLSQRLPC